MSTDNTPETATEYSECRICGDKIQDHRVSDMACPSLYVGNFLATKFEPRKATETPTAGQDMLPRYDPDCYGDGAFRRMQKDPDGEWVQADAADALLAEHDRLRRELEVERGALRAAGAVIGRMERERNEARAENADLRTAVAHAYTQGYRRGHHETVEATYADVHWTDEDTYFADDANEIIDASLAKHAPQQPK